VRRRWGRECIYVFWGGGDGGPVGVRRKEEERREGWGAEF